MPPPHRRHFIATEKIGTYIKCPETNVKSLFETKPFPTFFIFILKNVYLLLLPALSSILFLKWSKRRLLFLRANGSNLSTKIINVEYFYFQSVVISLKLCPLSLLSFLFFSAVYFPSVNNVMMYLKMFYVYCTVSCITIM